MVAGGIRPRRRVADGVLRMQLAANLINGFLNGAILEGGQMRASGGRGSNFEGMILDLIFSVLHRPDGQSWIVDVAVAILFAGGRLRSAGLWRKRSEEHTSELQSH